MRLRPRVGSGSAEQWQPRLYALLVGLLLIAAYVIAFIVKNDDSVTIDFVFFSARSSLIWLIILSTAIGVIAGVLVSQLYRRRATTSGGAGQGTARDG